MLSLLLKAFVLVVFSSPAPVITYSNGVIHAKPPAGVKTQGENIEILEQTKCDAKKSSTSSISVPETCGYVQGIYRFIYLNKEGIKEQAITDFSLNQKAKGSQVFLVGESITFNKN